MAFTLPARLQNLCLLLSSHLEGKSPGKQQRSLGCT